MTREEFEYQLKIYEQLKSILIENFFAREDSIFPEALLDEGLGLDSLEKVRLFNHLEMEFDIDFYDEEIDKTLNLEDLSNLINNKIPSDQLVLAL